MIGALFTMLLFSITAICAQNAAQIVGSTQANAARLVVAALVLGLWAHLWGLGLGGAALWWFFLSGVVGFGIGGWAMFHALPKLGASLSMLVVQCGSVLVATFGEWLWLGQVLTRTQIAGIALSVVGLAWGLAPRSWPRLTLRVWFVGTCWGLVSAAGQGWGAVLSRKAFGVARQFGENVDPGTAAYQRALAGLAFGLCMWGGALLWVRSGIVLRRNAEDPANERQNGRATGRDRQGVEWLRAWPWIVANAATGPILGVVCFQWALRSVPAGVVQSIVATAPLVTIPLAAWMDGCWPYRRYYAGAGLAVVGIAVHSLAR